MTTIPDPSILHDPTAGRAADRDWAAARAAFLAAVDPELRPAVTALLRDPRKGGLGLRLWLRLLAVQETTLPGSLPAGLVQVYLDDPEAVPLHDCAQCGLAVPVHPDRQDYEGEPARVYFANCPCCGGRTGLHAYWSNAAGRAGSGTQLQ